MKKVFQMEAQVMTAEPPKRIPRMRTAAKIVAEIKMLDPDSSVTEGWVRRSAKQGVFPVVWAGSKALINLDDVLEVLRIGTAKPTAEVEPIAGGIRRIEPKQRG